MQLEVKRPDHIVPSYSLTGDLLSYLRCPLRYRYENGSSLPPSRPVQQWFGEFLHGSLELAFHFWNEHRDTYPLPWPCTPREWREPAPDWADNDIGRFADIVETSLRQQGKQARNADARNSGYHRLAVAINELGQHLFPLIQLTEKKVIGTRQVQAEQVALRCSNYEVHGVIDVLTNVTLGQADRTNYIRACIANRCPDLRGEYEVVVDYKGAHRPLISEDYWEQGEWQIQTYAWLRSRQPDSLPVAAGILIYINELTPGNKEMENLRNGISRNLTDVLPEPGSNDEQIIRMWRPGNDTEQLSLRFRLQRAIRVIPVTAESIQRALQAFDNVVRLAEEDIIEEAQLGNILQAWSSCYDDEDTCSACDFRHFCPRPAGVREGYLPSTPTAP
ncbi:MAG: PD-(D/E)XK nuclease superfamily protein [Pelotomaculum sp. PtaU1.Bin035]|nr:MAG: PD-(D/E)XK nuclease superfamily protein [Pelotomaculum sp. PtaU1.Bin035]